MFFFVADEFLHFFLISSVISILKFLKEFCQEDFAVSVNPVLTSLVRSTLPRTPNACVESSRRYRKKFITDPYAIFLVIIAGITFRL